MIPIYEAKIASMKEGIFKISLVDLPAVESDFMVFNEKQEVKFSIQDEDQHIITGVVMRANFPIYRISPSLGEYYIKYSPETIKTMAEKMLADGTQNNINLMHEDDSDVNGVYMLELFIKDESKGISPKGFEDIEEGSLFASYKIDNEALWKEIKDGKFLGFSLEGIFSLQEIELKKQNKNIFNNIMNKLEKFLMNLLKFASVKTDKGEIFWVGDDDLEVGDEVYFDIDGERVKVEDGDYTTEAGYKITIEGGLVTYIETPEKNEEPEVEPEQNEKIEAAEDPTPAENEEKIDKTDEEKDKEESKLKADIDDLRKEHEALKEELAALKAIVDSMVNAPATDPIAEEYEKVEQKTKLGDKIKPTLKF